MNNCQVPLHFWGSTRLLNCYFNSIICLHCSSRNTSHCSFPSSSFSFAGSDFDFGSDSTSVRRARAGANRRVAGWRRALAAQHSTFFSPQRRQTNAPAIEIRARCQSRMIPPLLRPLLLFCASFGRPTTINRAPELSSAAAAAVAAAANVGRPHPGRLAAAGASIVSSTRHSSENRQRRRKLRARASERRGSASIQISRNEMKPMCAALIETEAFLRRQRLRRAVFPVRLNVESVSIRPLISIPHFEARTRTHRRTDRRTGATNDLAALRCRRQSQVKLIE